jgi:rare lipoprotein A
LEEVTFQESDVAIFGSGQNPKAKKFVSPRACEEIETRRKVAMKTILLLIAALTCACSAFSAESSVTVRRGVASWYGEEHRGKLMANGKPFDPDKMTAASWHYPLGSKVLVALKNSKNQTLRQVEVTITDRGPARRLVRRGRIIDLGHAAFQKLAHPDLGLIRVAVRRIQ